MLDTYMLADLEEKIRFELDENLTRILTVLNQQDRLQEFLQMIGLDDLLQDDREYSCVKNGKIIVLGQCEVHRDKLEGIAKSLGVDKNRFEFYLDYEDGKSFDPRHIHWKLELYSLVIVGPMPHKGKGIGDNGSTISVMENDEGYPPVIKAGKGGLKAISRSSFRDALEEALDKGWIVAA